MKFLTDHRFLNTENVKLLQNGDEVVWTFDTELNGRKTEKVIFHSVSEEKITSNWEDNYRTEERSVPCLDVTYISCNDQITDWGRVQWAHVRPYDNFFRIWTNGFNALRVLTINGKNWDELMMENNFNILSEEDQENQLILTEVEKLKNQSTYIGKVGYKEVYSLNKTTKVKSGYAGSIYVNLMSGFINVVSGNEPRLEASYPSGNGIKQQPFFKEVKGFGFSTKCISDYKKEQHFVFLNESIEAAKNEIVSNREKICVIKESERSGVVSINYVIPGV